jgi:hypothetical protein
MIIPKVASECFEKPIKEGRWSKRTAYSEIFQRPYAFKNLAFKPRSGEITPSQELFERTGTFGDSLGLPNAFYSSQRISWVRNFENEFIKIQEEILKIRKDKFQNRKI